MHASRVTEERHAGWRASGWGEKLARQRGSQGADAWRWLRGREEEAGDSNSAWRHQPAATVVDGERDRAEMVAIGYFFDAGFERAEEAAAGASAAFAGCFCVYRF